MHFGGTPTSRWQIVLPYIVLLAASFIFWNGAVRHVWPVVAGTCFNTAAPIDAADVSPLRRRAPADWNSSLCPNVLHGADSEEYYEYFTLYPDTFDQLITAFTDHVAFGERISSREFYKRPLYGVVSAFVSFSVHQATGKTFPYDMYDTLALYGALATILAFALCRSCGLSIAASLVLTLFATTSYAWLSIFPIPESYSISVCGTLAILISGVRMQAARTVSSRRIVLHLLIVIIASWLYLPNFGGVIFLLGLRTRLFSSPFKIALLLIPTLVAIQMPQLLAFGVEDRREFGSDWPAARNLIDSENWGMAVNSLLGQMHFANEWGSLWNFASPTIWLSTMTGLTAFAVVPSSFDLLKAEGNVPWGAIFAHPGLATLALVGIALVAALGVVLVRFWDERMSPPVIWLFLLVPFHVFLNPKEIQLYSSVSLALLLCIIARLAAQTGAFDRRTSAWIVAASILMLSAVNLVMVFAFLGTEGASG